MRPLLAVIATLVTVAACTAQAPTPTKPPQEPHAGRRRAGAFLVHLRCPATPPTLIRNATVLTGTGARIDGGDVLIVDGRIRRSARR